MTTGNTNPMTPEELVDWAIEQSNIQDEKEKAEKKRQFDLLVKSIPNFAATYTKDMAKGLFDAWSKTIPAIKSAGSAVKQQVLVSDAYNVTKRTEDNAKTYEDRYNNNPSAKNTKKWLETQADYKEETDRYLEITGTPWKKDLTFAPEVIAYIEKIKTKDTSETAKVPTQDIETSRESRRLISQASTAAQLQMETDRETRKVDTSQPLTPTIDGPAAQVLITADDPRVQRYVRTGLYTLQEAIQIVTGQQAVLDAAGAGGDGGGSTTQSSYKTFSTQQTESFANAIAQNLIGRALTPEELMRATDKLNIESKASPTVVKTVGGSTVQSGGIDAEQSIKSQLELAPEYANYQQATTYFDAMLGALRGTAGGGI
jgi:uncharacterized protein involved in outer membrane biogenesis